MGYITNLNWFSRRISEPSTLSSNHSIYIYIYLEPFDDLYFWRDPTPQNKGPRTSNQNNRVMAGFQVYM